MPSVNPQLLSDAKILAAYLIFLGSYIVFALGKFPWMKIDRPGAAIIGAVLMVAFRIVGAPLRQDHGRAVEGGRSLALLIAEPSQLWHSVSCVDEFCRWWHCVRYSWPLLSPPHRPHRTGG
jgi:hypothetical protein